MIGFLRGRVLKAEPDRILLDVNGVGYEVRVSFSTFASLEPLEDDAVVGLHIRTHVRDDAFELYGFASAEEKTLFDKLIGVSGIGPRLAQVVLSGMGWQDVVTALAGAQTERLVRIPGVGKKTAERMVLELRETATELEARFARPQPADRGPGHEELVSALVNLGYRRGVAERAAAEAVDENSDDSFPELLRRSLQRLSRA